MTTREQDEFFEQAGIDPEDVDRVELTIVGHEGGVVEFYDADDNVIAEFVGNEDWLQDEWFTYWWDWIDTEGIEYDIDYSEIAA